MCEGRSNRDDILNNRKYEPKTCCFTHTKWGFSSQSIKNVIPLHWVASTGTTQSLMYGACLSLERAKWQQIWRTSYNSKILSHSTTSCSSLHHEYHKHDDDTLTSEHDVVFHLFSHICLFFFFFLFCFFLFMKLINVGSFPFSISDWNYTLFSFSECQERISTIWSMICDHRR